MADRILPEAALRPTASPVDRYVQPVVQHAPQTNEWLQAASALSELNPTLQKYLASRNEENAIEAEAEGQLAEQDLEAGYKFAKHKEGWQQLVTDVRKTDPVQADRLAAANPHFRRGVVKARMNRLGMALSDHLMNMWRENPEVGGTNLHDIDDPQVVQQWMMDQTKAYTDRFGVGDMDPVLVNEVYQKRVNAAHDGLLARHTEFRLGRYQTEYLEELSANAGMYLMGAGGGDSSIEEFGEKLGISENSGRWGGANELGFTGKWQFGKGRLDDFNRANGTNFSLAQFDDTPQGRALQKRIFSWHIEDIDAEIDRQGFLDKGYSRDGLRAVAHLGGKGGMVKFVTSGGAYNPDDGYTKRDGTRVKGTKLSDYYRKFSGPAGQLQKTRDAAIADGMDPRKVNAAIVDQVILSAQEAGNPDLLDVIDHLDTGSGPVGRIGWVRDKVAAARARIEDAQWKQQEREVILENRRREALKGGFSNEATRRILEDPYADITDIQTQALDSGFTDLATSFGTLQETLINRDQKVYVDDALVTDLRVRISQGIIDQGEFYDTLTQGIANGLLDKNAATGLLDDFDRRETYTDRLGDRQLQSNLSDFNRVISERFSITDPSFGIRISGTEKGVEAEAWMRGRVMDYIKENEDATISEIREFSETLLEKALKDRLWQPVQDERDGVSQRPYGEISSTVDTFSNLDPDNLTLQNFVAIRELASSLGLTEKELMTRLGLVNEGN